MSIENQKNLTVFLSYSHSSEQHKKTIVELAERLTADGVKVIADFWDLKIGNNLHKFMEKMVTSTEISKVLLILDKQYQEKADQGKGGVGIESEIVSSQIYNKANQEKFIPVVWEKGSDNKPYLPVFLSSRIYVDLSSPHGRDEYPELLRDIFGKPKYTKPILGKMPTYLESESSLSVPSVFHSMKVALDVADLAKINLLSNLFFKETAAIIKSLHIEHESSDPIDEAVLSKINSVKHLVHEFDIVLDKLLDIPSLKLKFYLPKLFEQCIAYYSPQTQGNHRDSQFAAIQFVTQELFIHVVANFIKKELFSDLDEILKEPILKKRFHSKELSSILDLYEYVEALDRDRNNRLKLNRASITADLIKERADGHINFEDLIQADFILCLRADFSNQHWFPRTIVYIDQSSGLEVFIRGESSSYFKKFICVLSVNSKDELNKKWHENRERLGSYRAGWRPINLAEYCNLQKLDTKS